MQLNRQVSETLPVVGVINPSSQSVGAATSAAIDTRLYRRLFAVVNIGSVGAAGTVAVTYQAATTSGGVYANVGTAATTVTAGNQQVVMELDPAILTPTTGRFARLSVTVAGNAVLTSATVFAVARYEPGNVNNLTSVAQTVVSQ